MIAENARLSYRKHVQILEIKSSSLLTIGRKMLNLKPYKGQKAQKISDQDKALRLEMAEASQDRISESIIDD